MYVRDPGGFLVALVIRRCVKATEATMETARTVEEDWREVKRKCGARSWKVSLRLSPRKIVGSLLTLAALYTPARANVDGYFRRRKVSAWYRLMVRRAGDEKTG